MLLGPWGSSSVLQSELSRLASQAPVRADSFAPPRGRESYHPDGRHVSNSDSILLDSCNPLGWYLQQLIRGVSSQFAALRPEPYQATSQGRAPVPLLRTLPGGCLNE